MSWVLLTQDLPPGFVGGVASWVVDAANALAEGGQSVTVVARDTGDTAEWDARQRWPVVRVQGRSWRRWQGLWLARASRALVQPGVTVLCATWPTATGVAPRARKVGARVLVAAHGSELTTHAVAPRALRALLGTVEWRPVSAFLAGQLRRLGAPPERIRVTPMPLPLGPWPPPAGARVGLVCVARLTPLKAVERAIALARRLELPLTIVGDGPERAALEGAARGADVRFLGRRTRPDTLTTLSQAAAVVLLSRADPHGRGAEGLGLVLLEAAARGVPGVVSPVGGLPEAVGPGVVLDNPELPDLDPVRALLADPEAGARARRWVAQHHGPAAFRAALGGE